MMAEDIDNFYHLDGLQESYSSIRDDIKKAYKPYINPNRSDSLQRQSRATGLFRQNSSSVRNDISKVYNGYLNQSSLSDDIYSRQNSRTSILQQSINHESINHDRLVNIELEDLEDNSSTMYEEDIENIYYHYYPSKKRQTQHSVADTTFRDDINKMYKSYVHRNDHAENELLDDGFLDDDIQGRYKQYMYSMNSVLPGQVADSVSDDIERIYGRLALQMNHANRRSLHRSIDRREEEKRKKEEQTKLDLEKGEYEDAISLSTSISTTIDGTAEEDQSKWTPKWLRKLRMKSWWTTSMQVLKFALHFSVTMIILYLGALVFAEIEDPIKDDHAKELLYMQSMNYTQGKSHFSADELASGNKFIFFAYIKQTYNITVEKSEETRFLKELHIFDQAHVELDGNIAYQVRIRDRSFIFIKWFYFMVIASTTIGFGDVVPVTNNGKGFYIAFSIIAIPLMMTLLKTTAEMITIVNRKFFMFVNNLLCKKKRLVSEELLSSISVLVLFIGYISVGCVFTAATDKMNLLDSVYFWVNTFTTVGFGDILSSVEVQVKYFSFLVFYQIFGLTLLASMIDSWSVYLQSRRDAIIEENRQKLIKSVRHKSLKRSHHSSLKMNQENLDGLSTMSQESTPSQSNANKRSERRRTVTFNEPRLNTSET